VSGLLDAIPGSVGDTLCRAPELPESLRVSAALTLPVKLRISYLVPRV